MNPEIHLLLAPKERFEPSGAGAFALNALETTLASRWRDHITIFGSPVGNPFPSVRFRPLKIARWPLRGRNLAFADRYADTVHSALPGLVEIFNRPIMVNRLKQRLGPVPLLLYYGNDPRGMEGSRSAGERQKLLASAAAIVCVSDFIRHCFMEGIEDRGGRVHVVHTGVPVHITNPLKQKRIVFVGRLVSDKGVLELVDALARILPSHPDWSAEVIGARWFTAGEKPNAFERRVTRAAAGCGRIRLEGFRPHEEVLAALDRASIAVVPSKWEDPFPRTALEALAAGCALVCSNRGGLPEVGQNRALFLKEVSTESLAAALESLIANRSHRMELQARARDGFPFEIGRTTAYLDDLRDRLLGQQSVRLASEPSPITSTP